MTAVKQTWTTFRIDLAYHGALFAGYAIQPQPLRTVQAELQTRLSFLFQQDIKLLASGRTDALVHAYHQVCSFRVKGPTPISPVNIYQFLQKTAPDIHILRVNLVDNSFHAQKSVRSKTYQYIIQKQFDLTKVHLTYLYDGPIDVLKLQRCLDLFVGTHDFYSFTTSPNQTSTIRTINWIKVKTTKTQIIISINGNGFMRYMVRMLVGSAFMYATNKIHLSSVQAKLIQPQKGSAIYKMPGSGLYLKKIYY
ncbi:tRNA pseudouridine38-40 synthase [Mycoplasmoides fastidiosum]|uniref:tRNA pseudouridine synthase A n=1 Tax=Mycoplasmoides fastidiosum TaxID=92758 RepID=A0ABU0M045_9BACT|nr:tRNA pseudouridine(38-40) synthase TruA [Mycoplasmoides fastidiosum]MDQ0514325.1 tRNA pseudouridine38-40 synthase [Mycoplasmoides fastidiosum]UUD38072.1 tRNA pseudouridine(38-40) synthase TruA [Mycoplasmoides fastidiosum]